MASKIIAQRRPRGWKAVRAEQYPSEVSMTGTDDDGDSSESPQLGDAPRWLWLWFPIASIAVIGPQIGW